MLVSAGSLARLEATPTSSSVLLSYSAMLVDWIDDVDGLRPERRFFSP